IWVIRRLITCFVQYKYPSSNTKLVLVVEITHHTQCNSQCQSFSCVGIPTGIPSSAVLLDARLSPDPSCVPSSSLSVSASFEVVVDRICSDGSWGTTASNFSGSSAVV